MDDNRTFISNYFAALSGHAKTPEAIQKWVADTELAHHIIASEAAFPEYQLIPEEMIVERDLVAVRCQIRGVHKGVFAGIEPTGKTISVGMMIMYQVEDGKIVNHWMQFDMLSLLQQLKSEQAATAVS